MNKIDEKLTANQAIANCLDEETKNDPNLLVVTCDSRGSAGLVPFTNKYPDRTVEMGIAEQNAVTVAAGLAHEGKHPFVFSPAAFLAMRSIEQVKVDVAFNKNNVKLIGISGGNSYTWLGTTHHSLNDVAITRAIPDLEIYQPCDKYQVRALFKYLVKSDKPAYVRVGKRKLDNIYHEDFEFKPGKAKVIRSGKDICLISTGETLYFTLQAANNLAKQGIDAEVVDLSSIKPLDTEMIGKLAQEFDLIVTVEEHDVINGIGSAVASEVAKYAHAKLTILGFPDEPAIQGTQDEVFHYYGLDAEGIEKSIKKVLNK
ncbi:transketolase family protein [Lactobacillus mulieris]|uniref:transketolase family protein n=1 Tax=Lactobacillus mulieris TaxID=2508708 RepID=UPI001432B1E0|nr:transketolase C-terminal domain-containing protein [Lactobacillus mulieris]MCF1784103.1 transketolase family protein [Lactobacillus mulieris]MDK6803720.1 transketolase C-terminal domain-containing protein [Lactobacillus mulieris]MDK8382840.1 transketolase C-terminal domain-containing protein [Lactobacillus mulieris]MDT9621182.1 transketolase C-terminal domain-containing protein [Lactobacillus mulieris]NKC42069.1 transketolase family protein [Lactobacillus mulieris]